MAERHAPIRVRYETVGCRLNQYETEKMAAALAPFGFVRAGRDQPADLCIINTCTVTAHADRDSRRLARRAAQANPGAAVVLVGCYVETDPSAIAESDGVDLIVRNDQKDRIADVLREGLPHLFVNGCEPQSGSPLIDFHDHNRAWVKVSDGCNQTCSYCVVRIVRGRHVCRSSDEIVSDIRGLVTHGYNEAVLAGVNLGYYRDRAAIPPIRSLAQLGRSLLDRTGIARIRLSSIEPQTVSRELLELCAGFSARLCRHWHLPLQSGSDRILKLMRRPYRSKHYMQKAEAIREAVPGVVIGADVIVGFPGETAEDFEATRRLAESGLLDYLHVFSYSERPGTKAAALPDKVSAEVARERRTELAHLSAELRRRAHQRQAGEVLEVIAEKRRAAQGQLAVADNYLRVRLPVGLDTGKAIVRVRTTTCHGDYLDSELTDSL